MPDHPGWQRGHAAGQLGQRGCVALGQFFDALGELLAEAPVKSGRKPIKKDF